MDMNCTTFQANLDAYIDSELDRKTRRAMEEHAATCPECGVLLNQAVQAVTMCAELNEGLTVPLECQAAWRQAVRAEADAKAEQKTMARAQRRAGRSVWVRAMAGLAAALVLFFAVGTTLDMDSVSLPQFGLDRGVANNSAPGAYSDYDYRAYESASAYDYGTVAQGTASALGSVRLESDGSLTGDSAPMTTVSQKAASDVVVLRSAVRTIVTKEFENDALMLDDLVSEYSAYYESRRVTGNAEDASRSLRATIRVPSESLDNFLTALDVLGTITVREESAEDITADYNDVAARLEVLRSQLQQLNEMNARAKSVSDLIEINERANEVTAEIEAYESRIRDWNSRRSYSDVSLSLTEESEPAEEPEQKTLAERMKQAFEDSIEWLKDFGENAAVFGAALLPRLAVWLPVAIIVIVLLRVAFGRRGKKAKNK